MRHVTVCPHCSGDLSDYKECPECGSVVKISEFGKLTYCRECNAKRLRGYRASLPEKEREKSYQESIERISGYRDLTLPTAVKNHNLWTDEEMKQLAELYEEGILARDIAKILGRTYGSVVTKMSRMKSGE